MSCPVCGDKGIVRVRYRDGSPDEFGLCLCAAGLAMRSDRNAVNKPCGFSRWQVWAAREQVDPTRVLPVEELLEDAELARIPRAQTATQAASIAEVMRTGKRPRL